MQVHRVRYIDCPLCGRTFYSRSGPKRIRQVIQRHAVQVHGLLLECRLRSELADLAVQHTRFRIPGRTKPLFPCRPPPDHIPRPTEDEKKSGNTPRILAYIALAEAKE